MNFIFNLFVISFLPLLNTGFNNIADPQNEKEKIKFIQEQINKTTQLLLKSKNEKKQMIQSSALLQSQIEYRGELMKTIQKEFTSLSLELDSISIKNKGSLDLLHHTENEYKIILRLKWIQRVTQNSLLELLNTDGLKTRIRKWYWMNQLETKRKNNFTHLNSLLKTYFEKEKIIQSKILEKEKWLVLQEVESKKLANDILEKKGLITVFESKESNLSADLQKYKLEKDKMTHFIKGAILESRKDEKSRSSPIDIESNWKFPLNGGVITSRFGINVESANLKTKNNGIDIRSANPFVSAASGGEVIQIKQLPNNLYMVLIRNENLYTVYSNLFSVLVKVGEWINSGNKIGKCNTIGEDEFELHFEIWKGKNPVNPTKYLN